MSEESAAVAAIPAVEHVSLAENGVIMLSEEAQASMAGVQPPKEEAPEETPAPVAAEPAKPAEETPAQAEARRIKWNGQEVEIKPEQEVELLQKGYNYEQKMQQLEAERARLAAYNGLVQAIEASPDIRQKVSQALGYEPQSAKEEMPQFDDPIEQLKWETRQEVLREVEEKFIKPMQAKNEQMTHAQALNAVRQQVQADPQYREIQAAMVEQVRSLPESVGRTLFQQLDQDPRAYMEMFISVKERLKVQPTQTTPAAEETPHPVKRETKAPLLEGVNSVPDASAQEKQTAKIKELERRSRNGDYRAAGELMSMLA